MYQKPVLQKFGAFRDLTKVGFTGSSDGASVIGPTRRRRGRDTRIQISNATSS